MLRPYDLWITNLITNEVEIIKDFSFIMYNNASDAIKSGLLFVYISRYIDNQIPFKVEFNYKSL